VPLQAGEYSSPLVHLQQLQGNKTHLHVQEVRYRPSDSRLFQCSYTFGVVDATDPGNMKYLADAMTHKIPNDKRNPGCLHLAWDTQNTNLVYTTHHGDINNPMFVTGWDISKKDLMRDPTGNTLVQLPVMQEPGISYEGIDTAPNGNIFIALHDNGLGVYQRDSKTNVLTRIGTASGFTNALGVRARDNNTVVVTDGFNGLAIVDVTDPTNPKKIGAVAIDGGESEDVAVNGNTAYVAAGQAGMVVVDITDLTNPKVTGHASMPGSAIRLAYSAGGVFVAAWNDIRAYDVSDNTNPRFVGAARITVEAASAVDGDPDVGRPPITARNLGIAAWGDAVFAGNWYLLHSFRLRADRLAPYIVVPEDANDLIDFGAVAVGTTATYSLDIANDGTAPLTLFNNWTAGSAFSVTPNQVRVQPGDKTTLTVTYKAASALREEGALHIMSDDPAQPMRNAQLVGNAPGPGIGKPMPMTNMMVTDGSDWSTSQVKTGNVLLLAYFATF
jgi:hypothetical protein